MKLNKEAVNEIYTLLQKVVEVKNLVEKMGIYYDSDTWSALSPSWVLGGVYDNIFTWDKEEFENININNIDGFNIGGSVSIQEYPHESRELALAKGNTVLTLLEEIIDNFDSYYFNLSIFDNGLEENCGWERFIGINAVPNDKIQIREEIIKEIQKLVSQLSDDKITQIIQIIEQ